MKAIHTQTVIPQGEYGTVFDSPRCTITVDDEGGGPYLVIEGDDGDSTEHPHAFYLQTHEEIDEFAAICHDLLMKAEGVAIKFP